MEVTIGTVVFLNFSVDFLLLQEAGRAVGKRPPLLRLLLGAAAGGFCGGLSQLQRFAALAGLPGQLAVLLAVALLAFAGEEKGTAGGVLFVLLRFALEGMVLGLRSRSWAVQLVLAAGIAAACWWSMGGGKTLHPTVSVELRYGDRNWKIRGLRDTGNLLRDPLTGEQVLVAGAELGKQMLGLTTGQLAAPAQVLAAGLARGGRLIPYHSVGNTSGLLLALRLPEVKIGTWKGEALVAFSPTEFREGYQLLLGGGNQWKN